MLEVTLTCKLCGDGSQYDGWNALLRHVMDKHAALVAEEERPSPRLDYTREALIAMCVHALVRHDAWHDRDSLAAQTQVGRLWVLLRAGCEYHVVAEATDHDTVWVAVTGIRGFSWFEEGAEHSVSERFYLPTADRVARANGKDWY